MNAKKTPPPFPTKEQVLDFIRQSPVPVGKREIARAFNLRGNDRIPLKAMLKELKSEGLYGKASPVRKVGAGGHLPPVLVLEVTGLSPDGELLATPANWEDEAAPPTIYLIQDRKRRGDYTPGDRVLARLTRLDPKTYEASPIRKISAVPQKILGVYEMTPEGGRLRPTDKREKKSYILNPEFTKDAEPGDLVMAELRKGRSRKGMKEVQVVKRLGGLDSTRSLSLVAIHQHGIPHEFPQDVLEQAKAAGPAELGTRTDLRDIPLVTIDGADARDFDDAVWAEPDPENEGGWHVLVAIADVAHYVTPGSPLDREAYNRGNSTYFADRVVPMLPEELSNGWCSLNPDEDRPCMAVHLWLDADGHLVKHRFVRGLMRSRARLTYEQVQEALNGHPDGVTKDLLEPVLKPLEGAYQALLGARHERGTLELDIAEFKVLMDEDGEVTGIAKRERLESHKLIEEFMIAANVAAAVELESKRQPCMYRVHESPDPVKIDALATVLRGMGIHFAKGQVIRPKVLTRLLEKAEDHPQAQLVNEMVLRSQSQAFYSPENLGHFGLALTRYAHFTSPIRRYSDLLVHRGLVNGLKLGGDGLPKGQEAEFKQIGDHISSTERRSAAAERDSINRFIAAYLSQHVGQIFPGKVSGVTRAGLFVTLDETGADGLVPMSLLPEDYYFFDEKAHSLTGRRWGREYHLGDRVAVRIMEANAASGAIAFRLYEDEDNDSSPGTGAGLIPKGPHKKRRGNMAKAATDPKGAKSAKSKPGAGKTRARKKAPR